MPLWQSIGLNRRLGNYREAHSTQADSIGGTMRLKNRSLFTALAIMAVMLLSVISNPTIATAAEPANDCTDVVFNCEVAAALHLGSPGTPEGVKAKVADMSEKRLARYNARIERAVRKYVWLVIDYKIGVKAKIFDADHAEYIDNTALLVLLNTNSTLLDVVAVGRFHTHKSSSKHTHGPAVQGPKG